MAAVVYPTASFVSVSHERQEPVKIVRDEDAIKLISKGAFGITTVLNTFRAIKIIRKLHFSKVIIIQDQRMNKLWIAAGLIGFLTSLAGINQIWTISHQGTFYKTSSQNLLFTNIAYFVFYAPYILFGRFLSMLIAKILIGAYNLFLSPLAPKNGYEIPGWRIDMGWTDNCRQSVVIMNRVIRDSKSGQIKPEYLESRNCPSCGSSRWEDMFISEDGFNYVRCLKCGFFGARMVLNDKAFEAIRAVEPKSIHEFSVHLAKDQLTKEGLKCDNRRFNHYFKTIESVVKPNRLLDIGCATGNSLVVAQERGWQAIGIEQQDHRVEIATKRGLKVLHGKLEDLWGNLELSPGTFNTITMWETLEHIPNPLHTLKLIVQLLKPGGVLAITTDSYDSIEYRLLKEKHPACCGFGGYHGHINFFNARTLELLLSQARLDPIKMSSIGSVNLEIMASYFNLAWRNINSFSYYAKSLSNSSSQQTIGDASFEFDNLFTHYPVLSPRIAPWVLLWKPWVQNIFCELGMGSLVFGIAQKRENDKNETGVNKK